MTDFNQLMTAKRQMIRQLLEGATLWAAYVAAPTSTPAEFHAYSAWKAWIAKHPALAAAAIKLADHTDATASKLLAAH